MDNLVITPLSLVFSFSLVLIALAISYREQLGLGKELIVATFRMILQLVIAGYLLTYVFQLDNHIVTAIIMIIMAINAAYNASKRADGIPNAFRISLVAILLGVMISIIILVATGTLLFIPSQMIPVTGMLVGSAMTIIGLCFRNLNMLFRDQRQLINEKLSLGATPKQASEELIKESISSSLQPTIDSTRMVGLVTLPGMMTGMMMAGTVPLEAIMYQIMVYFMILATSTITSVITVYAAYKTFFDEKGRLER